VQSSGNLIHSGGSRLSVLMFLAWPAIAEQLLLTLVNYVDTAMVGSLGATATAAIAINTSCIWLVNGFLNALSVGYSVQVAYCIGAEEYERTRHVIRQSLLAVVVCGTALLLLYSVLAPFLPQWLGAEPDVLPGARAYIRIITLAFPFQAASAMFSAVLRCMGNTKTPLLLNAMTNLLNVILNFLLIYPTRTVSLFGWSFSMPGAGLGVTGAAIATAVATIATGLLLTKHLFSRRNPYRIYLRENYRPDKTVIQKAAKLGIPVAIERMTISFGQIIMTGVVTSLGTIALAANYVAATAEALCYLPANGVGYAATTLSGQCVGAREYDEAHAYGKVSGAFGFVLSCIMCLFLWIFAPPIASIFSPDPEVIALAARLLRIMSVVEPLFGLAIVLSGALRGAEDTRHPCIVGLACMWGIRVLFSLIVVSVLHMGLEAVWIVMCFDACARCILFSIRFFSKKWQKPLIARYGEKVTADSAFSEPLS